MSASGKGALPSQKLRELMEAGFIKNADEKNISPASLDLTLSEEAFCISGVLLPRVGERVEDLLSLMNAKKCSVKKPFEAGKMYLVRLNECLELPSQVYGYCNPKSSTGRLDVHIRVLADGVPRFDSITPKNYRGKLWAAIFPKSFSVQLHPDTALTQLRLFDADTRMSEFEIEIALKQYELMWHREEERALQYEELLTNDQDGSLILTAMISGGIAGYECIANKDAVLDVHKIGAYSVGDFFKPITATDGVLQLRNDHFYILSGAERVRIPPTLASEMIPVDERSGDFRSHYAGFLDPGWGWGKDGEGHGRPFTLEVRPFEDLVVREGQPVAKIKFERMSEEPDIHYDTKISNYLLQSGPKLAKQFK